MKTNFYIEESACEGKESQETCEDMLFLSDDFVAVIDGVTAKCDFRYEGKTCGKLAAEMVYSVLKALPAEADVKTMIENVNEEFSRFYREVPFSYDKTSQGPQAACVVYSAYRREIWMIGDCQAAVDGKCCLNPKKSDEILSEFRCLALSVLADEAENGSGMSAEISAPDESRHRKGELNQFQDTVRELILPWILKAARYANDMRSPYGYSILNGEPVPMSLIRILSLDKGRHEVILTSDGYPVIGKNLEESEEMLEKILREDPACFQLYHSTKGLGRGKKSFDDRTFVRFVVQ